MATIRVSSRRVDLGDNTLSQAVLKDYGETLTTANSSTAYTVDLTGGNVFKITMTGNCTFTFSNPPASGTAPTLTTTATTGTDILTFMTMDGGTTWYGFAAGIGMA